MYKFQILIMTLHQNPTRGLGQGTPNCQIDGQHKQSFREYF